jgi:HNH endonuclease
MSAEVGEEMRRQVADRAYHVCEYCLVHEEDLFHGCETDHIMSLKHSGQTNLDNLAHACFHCNRHKGTDIASISSSTGKLTRFFNPRADSWRAHFTLNGERILSITEIGEVTARILGFNHPDRLRHRELLVKSGRYPTIEALALTKD